MEANNSIALAISEDELTARLIIADENLLSEKSLYNLLQEQGIKYGINQEITDDLLKKPRKGSFDIANGKPPREGQDGYVQYMFTKPAPRETEQNEIRIDFREVFNVPSVNAKTVLAVYHPAVQGEDGMTVTGQVIPAQKAIDLSLKTAKGAEFSADGRTVSSTINGRSWELTRGKDVIIGVDVVYWHQGDVDIKTGNLRLLGDVVITGNVMENMIVNVTGNLKVDGFISRAQINVGKNFESEKVITASMVSAGGVMASYGKLENQIREITKVIESLDILIVQLMDKLPQSNKNITIGQLIMVLLQKKFTSFSSQVQLFCNEVKKIGPQAPPELVEAGTALTAFHGINVLSIKSLEDIKKSAADAVTFFDILTRESAHISAHSVWNSELEATGNIIIGGQGAFNSKLTAQGAIEIIGVFRGGEMYAREGVKAGEIGGSMGIKTLVRTDDGKFIKARRLFNGSILQIGNRTYTARRDYDMVLARVNEHGDVVLF